MKLRNIQDVTEGQMCVGCGACAYISPDEIEMADVLDFGRRPILGGDADPRTAEAMKVCPGIHLEHTFDPKNPELIPDLIPAWGPVMQIWEGFAADDEIRFAASSGGAATALALYCLEQESMQGVLHITAREDVPYLNHTVLSQSRTELLQATGSRYAPASPCDGLQKIEDASGPCVFIGKPCDVAAVEKARNQRPALDEKVGVTISIFCAGTPSTRGTLKMLDVLGAKDLGKLKEVRYRGRGWPGSASARFEVDGVTKSNEMSYEDSWGDILQKHRQWRCYICIDNTGEFADIAVGDPWYRDIEGDPGQSLVLARTERGRRIVEAAIRAGYLELEKREPHILPDSQGGFLPALGHIWARLWVLRLMGAPAPRYVRMPMFRFFWRELGLRTKARAFLGTVWRVFRKRLRQRAKMEPMQIEPASTPQPPASEAASTTQ